MGLDSSDPNSKTFSKDVLKIEICGPDQEHLSVIDVPGIFKKTTEGLTTKFDMYMVRNMVFNYMKNPRAVILQLFQQMWTSQLKRSSRWLQNVTQKGRELSES